MEKVLDRIQEIPVKLPNELIDLLQSCKSYRIFNSTVEIAQASTNGKAVFEVKYDVPGKGEYTEAVVHRVKNGIAANYTEAYMRRRDPDTMIISDDLPTDKDRFRDKFGYEFDVLKKETMDWLKQQDLALFFYFAGRHNIGVRGIAIVPVNAAFFAMGLSMLQAIVPIDTIDASFKLDTIIYIAPVFRHTHFNGKQIVVHNRLPEIHEMFSYNLYPGPSAKKGLYGMLLSKGEKEGWVTTHCSTVQVVSPYDNITTFMHEGASGGGKSEMLQHIIKEEDGTILLGENTLTGEKRYLQIPIFCTFNPVTDDMALCPPQIQQNNGKLRLIDAENSWFVRVDGVKNYGDEPFLEKMTMKPPKPLLFLNIDAQPDATALIWDHIEDSPGKPCPNPRVVLPRDIVPNIVEDAVSVDIRSFGVRTPPCTSDDPSYGILGLFHFLPPALAWLWRLVSPRGHANPSIVGGKGMQSEGVGSYWPFATGEMVIQANLLLEQIQNTPKVKYTLAPNQHIGVWKVAFKPQLLMREYLTRRGSAKLRADQYQPARCSLLGYELNYLSIEGSKIPSRFLKVYRQLEVGEEGYDKGAQILHDFFKKELQNYQRPTLSPLGKRIIDAFHAGADVQAYEELIPSV